MWYNGRDEAIFGAGRGNGYGGNWGNNCAFLEKSFSVSFIGKDNVVYWEKR